ncbi:MAG: hypothetical protein F6J90_10475 [Moorea sp. SIOASIH]|nr:hypothetical protein [Moorena sp. SIOASIH]
MPLASCLLPLRVALYHWPKTIMPIPVNEKQKARQRVVNIISAAILARYQT